MTHLKCFKISPHRFDVIILGDNIKGTILSESMSFKLFRDHNAHSITSNTARDHSFIVLADSQVEINKNQDPANKCGTSSGQTCLMYSEMALHVSSRHFLLIRFAMATMVSMGGFPIECGKRVASAV